MHIAVYVMFGMVWYRLVGYGQVRNEVVLYRGGMVGMVGYVHDKNKPGLLHLAISIMGHGARKFMH